MGMDHYECFLGLLSMMYVYISQEVFDPRKCVRMNPAMRQYSEESLERNLIN